MRRLVTALLLALSVGAIIVAPAPAAAHAVLVETVPDDGAVLDGAPAEIILRFNEPVSPLRVQVIGPGGAPVAGTEDARAENRDVIIALPGSLSEGTHVVSFRVRSMDVHPVGGAIAFAVGTETAPAMAAGTGEWDGWWRVVEGTLRAIEVTTRLLTAGGVFYLLLVGGAALPGAAFGRALAAAAIAGIAAIALKGGAHGALLLGASPWELATAETWRAGFDGRQGMAALLSAGGMGLIAAGCAARGRGLFLALALPGAALALAGFGFVGHMAGTEPRWLMRGALYVHVAAIAFWLGALFPLWLATRHTDAASAAPAVARFSRIALGAVPLIAVSGLVMVGMLLTRPGDLATTVYGVLLTAKLVLVAGLLAIAARNKLSHSPLLALGDHAARQALNRNIALEGGLMAIVLGVAVAMAQSVPPRSLADQNAVAGHDHHHGASAAGIVQRVRAGGHEVEITISPGRAGRNSIRVRVADAGGAPIDPIEVAIEIASEGWGIEPIHRELRDAGGGIFEHSGNEMSLPGKWELRVDVLITDFDKPIFRAGIEVE